MSTKLAAVFNAAADRIAGEGGWFQLRADLDEKDRPSGRNCAMTAIHHAAKAAGVAPRVAYEALYPLLGIDGDSVQTLIGEWNDAPERTQDEVVAKLREAAVAAGGAS